MSLLDLDHALEHLNSILAGDPIFEIFAPGGLKRLATGVYDGHFNLSNRLDSLRGAGNRKLWEIEDYPIMSVMQEKYDRTGKFPKNMHEALHDFGVADSVEQILEYFSEQVDDPDVTYIIGATPVLRDLENKGQGGGWRWHKWGPYIGTKEPTMEYLDDEPEIDQVIVFHLYQITELP